jgi:hypothetical protein
VTVMGMVGRGEGEVRGGGMAVLGEPKNEPRWNKPYPGLFSNAYMYCTAHGTWVHIRKPIRFRALRGIGNLSANVHGAHTVIAQYCTELHAR